MGTTTLFCAFTVAGPVVSNFVTVRSGLLGLGPAPGPGRVAHPDSKRIVNAISRADNKLLMIIPSLFCVIFFGSLNGLNDKYRFLTLRVLGGQLSCAQTGLWGGGSSKYRLTEAMIEGSQSPIFPLSFWKQQRMVSTMFDSMPDCLYAPFSVTLPAVSSSFTCLPFTEPLYFKHFIPNSLVRT